MYISTNSLAYKQNNMNSAFCFKGHLGSEYYLYNSFGKLIHETAFFREPKSNKSIKNFVFERLKTQDNVTIISAGCSTGEEAVTQSILLDDVKDKVKIIGIDLSKKAIKKAKSRTFLFEKPQTKNKYNNSTAAYHDAFLVFKDDYKPITHDDIENEKLFDKFFETDNNTVFLGIWKNIQNVFKNMFAWYTSSVQESVKLRNGMVENCAFYQDDILNINKYTTKDKADVILFRNVLYHFISELDMETGDRYLLDNYKGIIENIMRKFKNSLAPDGIICFGENETIQHGVCPITIDLIMQKLNFKPLKKTKGEYTNIWRNCDA